MAEVVVMPKVGAGVETCLLVAWRVDVGDTVAAGTPVCDVETDQATALSVAARTAGTVFARLAEAGSEIPVKAPLLIVGQPGDDVRMMFARFGLPVPAIASAPAKDPEPAVSEDTGRLSARVAAIFGAAEAKEVTSAEVTGSGTVATELATATGPDAVADPAEAAAEPTIVAAPAEPAAEPHIVADPPEAASPPEPAEPGPKAASPRARELAAVYGITIDDLVGTGPRGRVIERDVLAAVSGQARLAAPGTPLSPESPAVPSRAIEDEATELEATGPDTVAAPEDPPAPTPDSPSSPTGTVTISPASPVTPDEPSQPDHPDEPIPAPPVTLFLVGAQDDLDAVRRHLAEIGHPGVTVGPGMALSLGLDRGLAAAGELNDALTDLVRFLADRGAPAETPAE
ncbi:MAG: E3 binding domain-containing protein [Propionibacteriaceae bacterium]|jgi:pyruvate dehydrogenase E2 component (dihydrolipoamide acetyltransferase)|nr:E3 binding domain-containing protein [Propionibacteriaceae bacterium]